MSLEFVRLQINVLEPPLKIPFSTALAQEQTRFQNQKEVLSRLELNEKMEIFENLVEKLDNGTLI